MAKRISFQQGLSSLLFWSIISAAFIGPGTVTTAARAGAAYQLQLLWALFFSILATIVLQETAARITLASGKNLGEIIAIGTGKSRSSRLRWFLFLAVGFGCAAYEAGNLLGAMSGLLFFTGLGRTLSVLLVGSIAVALLWMGNFRAIARWLGAIVALMGITFLVVAFLTPVSLGDFWSGLLIPHVPSGSALLIIGLIGTTIVPYNLFLASGISQGQDIREMRLGIITAVLLGGAISAGILVVGTGVVGTFSFATLAQALTDRLGPWANILFGVGLFAAGMSSAVTAPFAAAITGRSLLGGGDFRWEGQGVYFRLVWGGILFIGVMFGLLDFRPIPVIIAAQAINGLLLPLVASFLLLAANNTQLLTLQYANKPLINGLTLGIVGVAIWLGLYNIWQAVVKTDLFPAPADLTSVYLGITFLALGITGWLATQVRWRKGKPEAGN